MLKSGKQWPIFVAAAIMGVVLLSYWTIKETMQTDLSQSDMYLSKYQNIDENINDYLQKNIEFDRRYEAKLVDIDLGKKEGFIRYLITTKKGKPVDNAQIELVLTRPIADAKDLKLTPSSVKEGIYSFEHIHLPKKGRWDLILHIRIGQNERFYNLKADTRTKTVKPI